MGWHLFIISDSLNKDHQKKRVRFNSLTQKVLNNQLSISYSALALHKLVILPILAEPHKQTGLADINITDQQHLVSWDTTDIIIMWLDLWKRVLYAQL